MLEKLLKPHPKRLTGSQALEFVESTNDIKRASLVETHGKDLLCEVEASTGTVIHLQNGVKTVGLWLRLKAKKEGVELPDYLLVNE
ncbi:MAG: hypothetical protein C9356_20070 [Oleiphilus sp.]|nr:MAG: hypothetical protein C9356_20070 [Oleiphilus sp.]